MDLGKFSISKPTLRDIPAMRSLILPEVQRGVILDRTEDEMASAIRSYSIVRENFGNSSLGIHSADSTHPLTPSARGGEFLDSSESKRGSILDEKSGLRSYEQGNRTDSSLTKRIASLPDLSLKDNAPIIAFAALQILSPTLAEIRSLIVGESYRRMGLATHLINHILGEAKALNLKEVLALTYQKEVFAKIGFVEIAKDSLPNQKIWADCIKCKKFPICDEIALLKTL